VIVSLHTIKRYAVPALANAGPDCDSCGGPLKVIMQREREEREREGGREKELNEK
jgi:hypothetical protein